MEVHMLPIGEGVKPISKEELALLSKTLKTGTKNLPAGEMLGRMITNLKDMTITKFHRICYAICEGEWVNSSSVMSKIENNINVLNKRLQTKSAEVKGFEDRMKFEINELKAICNEFEKLQVKPKSIQKMIIDLNTIEQALHNVVQNRLEEDKARSETAAKKTARKKEIEELKGPAAKTPTIQKARYLEGEFIQPKRDKKTKVTHKEILAHKPKARVNPAEEKREAPVEKKEEAAAKREEAAKRIEARKKEIEELKGHPTPTFQKARDLEGEFIQAKRDKETKVTHKEILAHKPKARVKPAEEKREAPVEKKEVAATREEVAMKPAEEKREAPVEKKEVEKKEVEKKEAVAAKEPVKKAATVATPKSSVVATKKHDLQIALKQFIHSAYAHKEKGKAVLQASLGQVWGARSNENAELTKISQKDYIKQNISVDEMLRDAADATLLVEKGMTKWKSLDPQILNRVKEDIGNITKLSKELTESMEKEKSRYAANLKTFEGRAPQYGVLPTTLKRSTGLEEAQYKPVKRDVDAEKADQVDLDLQPAAKATRKGIREAAEKQKQREMHAQAAAKNAQETDETSIESPDVDKTSRTIKKVPQNEVSAADQKFQEVQVAMSEFKKNLRQLIEEAYSIRMPNDPSKSYLEESLGQGMTSMFRHPSSSSENNTLKSLREAHYTAKLSHAQLQKDMDVAVRIITKGLTQGIGRERSFSDALPDTLARYVEGMREQIEKLSK
jgi:hypothetical protein